MVQPASRAFRTFHMTNRLSRLPSASSSLANQADGQLLAELGFGAFEHGVDALEVGVPGAAAPGEPVGVGDPPERHGEIAIDVCVHPGHGKLHTGQADVGRGCSNSGRQARRHECGIPFLLRQRLEIEPRELDVETLQKVPVLPPGAIVAQRFSDPEIAGS